MDRRLVVDEKLVAPSAVVPTLFVGLGGCGCRMVMRVAWHLRQRPDYRERYADLVKFALVDTNINDLELHREYADETFLISDFEKAEYARLATGQSFLEPDDYLTQWVPRNYRFRAGDTAGAGQIRIESRLGVYYQMKHGDLVSRFRALLESLKSHEHGHRRLDSSEIRVVVCYSVAGGTGSGAHLSLAYMLRDQAKQLGKPQMLGVAVLPSVFENFTGANKDGTFANGYAALKETEHFMKLGSPDSRFFPDDGLPFHYDPSDPSKRRVYSKPFEWLYVVDKPESFSVPNVVDAASDALYLQLFSPLFGVQMGDYDNYTQHQRFLVPHDFEGKGIAGFTSFYGSYGAAVLLVPTAGLVEYCSQASALSLMRANFVHEIPGDPEFARLRSSYEDFYQVTEEDSEGARPIKKADFSKRDRETQARLHDRLYARRIRLLSACELDSGREDGRFFAIFKHGHRPGTRPGLDGTLRVDGTLAKAEWSKLNRMSSSIGAFVLESVGAPPDGRRGQPGLLEYAQKQMQRQKPQLVSAPEEKSPNELVGEAAGWVQILTQAGERAIQNDFTSEGREFPGLESLTSLKFLDDDAAEVDLAAKRYAAICIGEGLPPAPRGGDAREEGFDGVLESMGIEGRKLEKPLKDEGGRDLADRLFQQAASYAMTRVRETFFNRLKGFRDRLEDYARTHRVLEEAFDHLERDQQRRLDALQEQGDHSANKYVLDAEALQMENGRRLWDFFYEDRVAGLGELSLGDKNVQRVLGETVTHLSRSGGGASSSTLEQLFKALRRHAAAVLDRRLGGDLASTDPATRDGLVLSDALELEVLYRALFLSSADEVNAEGAPAVRRLVADYRTLPPERRLDLGDPRHVGYLRDKVKRVVKEKADLLCSYDESRDEHGGVRPDRVFLAAIDEDFRSSTIEEALIGADIADLKWVTRGWHDPKKVVFYRAVLNVPIYVFGRMDEMKDHYYRFKRMAKRSKVLHIAKDWEDALPDLDPVSAQEAHRQALVRQQIINFSALLTIRGDGPLGPGTGEPCVVRRERKYLLRDPYPATPEPAEEAEVGFAVLGTSIADAVEHLPEVLDASPVKYRAYQQVLKAVREGLAPTVLQRVVRLPFKWRQNRDQLRTQYGSQPNIDQQEKLGDYTDAFERLTESMAALLERLRETDAERAVAGDGLVGNAAGIPPEQAAMALQQSIRILATFSDEWQALSDPERSNAVPRGFGGFFGPMNEGDLNRALQTLTGLGSGEPQDRKKQGFAGLSGPIGGGDPSGDA
jgi:hypothetical protein